MSEQDEQIRKEFEAWGRDNVQYFSTKRAMSNPEEYVYDDIHFAWLAYKAGRASFVVELPQPRTYVHWSYGNQPCFNAEKVIEAIEAAGGRVRVFGDY